jgi:Family of unknown function (DUF6247)
MTAAARDRPEAHPLARRASPATVCQWLIPHDEVRFVTEYEIALALDDARASLDLGGVFDVVERWRRIAILQTDPGAYRRTMRLAAERVDADVVEDQERREQQGVARAPDAASRSAAASATGPPARRR